ncbi:MAG: hypothetical protein V4645_18195 [Pseudomonadota bacterium]
MALGYSTAQADYLGLGGTDDLAGGVWQTLGAYGGDYTSIGEGGDAANGSYNYVNGSTPGGITSWGMPRDAVEQARMGAGYPDNGKPWDWNAATMGVSRLIDSASRAYAVANGTLSPTYAGQNGLTYQNGRQVRSLSIGNNLLPLLLIAGAVFLLAK